MSMSKSWGNDSYLITFIAVALAGREMMMSDRTKFLGSCIFVSYFPGMMQEPGFQANCPGPLNSSRFPAMARGRHQK